MKREDSIRITPACAGTTLPVRNWQFLIQDHPRLWEQPDVLQCPSRTGITPPVREQHKAAAIYAKYCRITPACGEQLTRRAIFSGLSGITPACAGTTDNRLLSRLKIWDHPRLCGNNIVNPVTNGFTTGSPPPVREQHGDIHAWGSECGITPACAGTTDGQDVGCVRRSDHPRLCGNNVWCYFTRGVSWGSPPPVREQPLWHCGR